MNSKNIKKSLNRNEKAQDVTDTPKYHPVYLTSNAITLSDKIQLRTMNHLYRLKQWLSHKSY